MAISPGADPDAPLTKRRKVIAVMPSPQKLSELMFLFDVQSAPSSTSKRNKDAMAARSLRAPKETPKYAESAHSESPQPSPGARSASGFGQTSSSSDELLHEPAQDVDEYEEDEDDVIHPVPRSNSTRIVPRRSTRNNVSYSSTKKVIKKKGGAKGGKKSLRLTSDLGKNTKIARAREPTQRQTVRHDIAAITKPKRDAFLLAHAEYFLPLLPENSYIDKLQRLQAMSDQEPEHKSFVPMTEAPTAVKAQMKPYQLEGLSFLRYMHDNGMPSILGDEMGLGKTLQTLSLFQYLKEYEPLTGENRPFLVICPLSVLSSWMNEAKKWTPELNVVRFHGPRAERDNLKEESRRGGQGYDVVVTTYETFVAEQNWFKRAFVWRYCVLDEGHKVKNDKSNVSHALQSLKAEYRLLLTGTPLQNNLHEMWALLHWLYPEVFNDDTSDKFKRAFDLSLGRVSTAFMDDARRLLELIMLRRMKSGVNLGLPPKEDILLYVPLTPMQRFWYTRLLTRADNLMLEDLFSGAKSKEIESRHREAEEDEKQRDLFEKASAELAASAQTDDVWAESKEIMVQAIKSEQQTEIKGRDWHKLMNLIIQLRKVCSHPYILPGAAPDYYIGDHIKTASGKFIVLDKLVEELVLKRRKKILIFSGWTKTLDLVEDLLVLKGANTVNDAPFRYLRMDGSTARARRTLAMRQFNDHQSGFDIMLISTRAGGLGVNLASASDVVFMDEDWNPTVTQQAEARAHRIGQQNKVTVYKLCTQGTVEEQMMGRIRKKLYLSAKITESMRNIHSTDGSKKRKRGPNTGSLEEDAPQLDATSLKSLIRRGAQTLSRPEVDVTEMVGWDWETTLERCKDKPLDDAVADPAAEDPEAEQSWLNSMERVETAVFEGKKHHKSLDKATAAPVDLARSDRRLGKNTTVQIDGYDIDKRSALCGEWEAVPTMAGKDPRLAEPKREKRPPVVNQDYCQTCWDGGEIVCCSSCPRSYHVKCLDKAMQLKAKSKLQFYCSQHECLDCQAKTSEAGGLIFRCRWCENGFCEDCMDWDQTRLLGETLPEYEMLDHAPTSNAWYIECARCVQLWEQDPALKQHMVGEKARIEAEYAHFLESNKAEEVVRPESAQKAERIKVLESISTEGVTPATNSEAVTPIDREETMVEPKAKAFQKSEPTFIKSAQFATFSESAMPSDREETIGDSHGTAIKID